jgi:ketosteroid isomerase-like protein
MAVERAPELEEVVRACSAAWRRGDAIAVESFISTEDEVVMGSPGPNPTLSGRDAVVAVLRQIVPMSAGPNGGKAEFTSVQGYRDGNVGWCYAEGVLTLPGKGRHAFRGSIVLRNELGKWKWVHWCAFIPVPLQLMGTEMLGFV